MSEKQPLHPATEYLVVRGMAAVRDKLARAEQKYGYRDGWLSPNWMSECRAKMYHHITKGDPLDVIAYCLFLWHHGAPTCRPGFHVELLDAYDVVLDRRDLFDFARSAIEYALRVPQYDGVGMSATWYLEESTRRAEEFVEKFANRIPPVDEVARTNANAPAIPKLHCQNNGDVCLAGNRDGICCPEESCDIDDGIRKDPRMASPSPLPPDNHATFELLEAAKAVIAHGSQHDVGGGDVFTGTCDSTERLERAIAAFNCTATTKCMCSGLGPCEKRLDGSCRLGQQSASPHSDPVGEWGELREFVERENAAAREGGEHADR